jgi:hypothetical protein
MHGSAFVLAVAVLAVSGCAMTPPNPGPPGSPRTEACVATSEQEIASLFDRWNNSLQTGDPHKVVANYAPQSVLLATVSSRPRITPEDKEDYFH